jgi:hypothetical protein
MARFVNAVGLWALVLGFGCSSKPTSEEQAATPRSGGPSASASGSPMTTADSYSSPSGGAQAAHGTAIHDRPEFLVDLSSYSQASGEIRLNGSAATIADLAEKTAKLWPEYVAAKQKSRSQVTIPPGDTLPVLAFLARREMTPEALFTVVRTAGTTGAMKLRLLSDDQPMEGAPANAVDAAPLDITLSPVEPDVGAMNRREFLLFNVHADAGGRVSAIDLGPNGSFPKDRPVEELKKYVAVKCLAAEAAGDSTPDAWIEVDDRIRYGELRAVLSACARRQLPDGTWTPACRISLVARPSGSVFQNARPGGGDQRISSQLRKKIEPATNLAPTVNPRPAVRVDVGAVNVFTQGNGTISSAAGEAMLGAGYDDAMDRITLEILNMLAKEKVLVVWAIDRSQSMQDERSEIAARIDRMYAEIGLSAAAKGDALQSAVLSYGPSTIVHSTPTHKGDEITAAFKSIPIDPTGEEKQTDAVLTAMKTFGPIAQGQNRRLALILVSDESGDSNGNASQLESAIQAAKLAKAKVYVYGRETAFGSGRRFIRHHDPETKSDRLTSIDRGPETAAPETLQTDGLTRRIDAFPSGFGPYEQSRMTRETGGGFFMFPKPEEQLVGSRPDLQYDADAMRPYLPDLRARQDYLADRDRSQFRKVIAQVIRDLDPVSGPNGNPDPVLSKGEVRVSGFPLAGAALASEGDRNMQKAASLLKLLASAEQMLESVSKDRPREKSPRWRANYDLIRAQVPAYQVRLNEYGFYLAEFTRAPRQAKPSAAGQIAASWKLKTTDRQLKPETTRAVRERADAAFRVLVQEYAGTPWGAWAEEELKRGYGVELVEDYDAAPGASVATPKY